MTGIYMQAGTSNVTGAVSNSGTLSINAGTMSAGSLANAGILALGAGAGLTAGAFTQTAGSTNLSDASLAAETIAITGGILSGSGTLTGAVGVTNATVQVGPDATSLHIAGNYSHSGGFIVFEIDPNSNGGFAESTLMLDPGNTTSISNTDVVFDFLNGADPLAFFDSGAFNSNTFFKESDGSTLSARDLYQMLSSDTYTAESSTYDITSFSYDPGIGATALTEGSPVPLPPAHWLFLGGLGSLAAIARRRPQRVALSRRPIGRRRTTVVGRLPRNLSIYRDRFC
jgi:hypothetical protein